uniref:Uncharacterized protein n=2 Tax=Biomphalaria glabrata TaxID=6526 RepID=A0A2C9LQ57_BIOGL
MCFKFAAVFRKGSFSLRKCVYIYFMTLSWNFANGQYIFKFYSEDNDGLRCHVNFFPKIIKIINEFTGRVMIIKNNTNRMEETTSVDGSFQQTDMECENTGVYICVVTDFNNNVNQRKLVKTSPGCPVKFCDATYRTILNTAVNTAVNFSLCLFYNDNIELVAVNTPTEYIQLVSKNYYGSENYLLLHFLIDNVHQSFPGNHTIEIITVNKRSEKRETLNRMITLVTHSKYLMYRKVSNL